MTMFTAVLLFFVGLALVVNAKPDEECMKLGEPATLKCCKKLPVPKVYDMMEKDVQSCFKEPNKPPPSCDFDICVGTLRGFATKEGSLIKNGFETVIETEFEEYPELVANIKETCINGDLSHFGPDEMCEVMKARHCILLFMEMQCPEWVNTGACNGVEDLVKKCSEK